MTTHSSAGGARCGVTAHAHDCDVDLNHRPLPGNTNADAAPEYYRRPPFCGTSHPSLALLFLPATLLVTGHLSLASRQSSLRFRGLEWLGCLASGLSEPRQRSPSLAIHSHLTLSFNHPFENVPFSTSLIFFSSSSYSPFPTHPHVPLLTRPRRYSLSPPDDKIHWSASPATHRRPAVSIARARNKCSVPEHATLCPSRPCQSTPPTLRSSWRPLRNRRPGALARQRMRHNDKPDFGKVRC